jgi:hypothetical protein
VSAEIIKLGITATREGLTRSQHEAFRGWLYGLHRGALHHGLCVGGDEQVHYIARMRSWHIVAHPGDTPALRSTTCAPDEMRPVKPNLARNRDIVNETQHLAALPKGPEEQRSGTWSTIRYARKLGRPITIFWPDGSITDGRAP